MSERLILVRHTAVTLVDGLAPSEWRASPEGLEDAERLATAPLFAGAVVVASSPERKALATAEPIAKRLGVEVAVEADLREVARPAGPIVSSEEYGRRVAAYLGGGSLDGWEHPEPALQRATECIERLRRNAGGPLVVVSHGLLLTLYRGDSIDLWRGMPLPAVAVSTAGGFGPWLSVDEAVRLY
jgi:broad specificity phosphatase PhoE